MENSTNITKLQTSESNVKNCAGKTRLPLGCAFAIDHMASVMIPSMKMNTHTVRTGEAGDRIQNGWGQLGGVEIRSPKRQYDKPTKTAQQKMKYVCYAAVTGILIIWTIKWTAWLGSHPFGERNWSQRAENGVTFRRLTTSKVKLQHHSNTTKLQQMVSDRHQDVKEGVLNPGSITLNDRPWTNMTARNKIDHNPVTQAKVQPQSQAKPTSKMSDRHCDLKEGFTNPDRLIIMIFLGSMKIYCPPPIPSPPKLSCLEEKFNIISCNFKRRLWEAK